MLNPSTEFQYFHSYQRLAREKKASPLTCTCGIEYNTREKDGRLHLWCVVEDAYVLPGFKTQHLVEKTVHQHYGEIT